MITIQEWQNMIAFVLICAIVFVEQIDILYSKWMISFLFILLVLNIFFMFDESFVICLLIAILITLVFIIYSKQNT